MTPSTFRSDLVVGHAPEVMSEELSGGIVLYSIEYHKAVHLNETASLIWRLSDGSRTVRQIIEDVLQEFPDDGASVRADVTETLSLLLSEGILSPVSQ